MKNYSGMLALLAAFLLEGGSAFSATTYTWNDGGADDLWTNPDNWGGTVPGTGDTAQFNATAGGNVDIAGNSVDLGATGVVKFDTGADGIDIIGSGALSAKWQYSPGAGKENTISVDFTCQGNSSIANTGTLNIAADFSRSDTFFIGAATVNIKNGAEVSANGVKLENGASGAKVNIEAGGLVTTRYQYTIQHDRTTTTEVWGTLDAGSEKGNTTQGLVMKYDNNRVVIHDGGLVFGRMTMNQSSTGVDSLYRRHGDCECHTGLEGRFRRR